MDDTKPGRGRPAEVSRLLSLRDADPAPSSTVDVDRAIRTGRRTAKTRKTIGIAVAACLTVAIALGIPAALRGSHQQTPAHPPAQTFNVLRQAFTVGTVGGYTPATYQTGRAFQRAYLKVDRAGQGLPAQAVVTVYAKGQLPNPGWTPGAEVGPKVEGRATYWQPGTGARELAWQWQAGSWAFARIDGVGSGLDARVEHIIEGVRPAAIPVRFPFTATKPAIAAQLVGVLISPTSAQSTMLLAGTDPADPVLAGVTKDINLDPYTGRRRTSAPDGEQTVTLTGGWTAYAEAPSSGALSALGGTKQTLTALAHSIQLVANPGQQSSWVRKPFR